MNSKALIISASHAPLGQGKLGGITPVIRIAHDALSKQNIDCLTICPKLSEFPGELIKFNSDTFAQDVVNYLNNFSNQYDYILNFSSDLLIYNYALENPNKIHHIIRFKAYDPELTKAIVQLTNTQPLHCAFKTKTQLKTFPKVNAKNAYILGTGIDVTSYLFNPFPTPKTVIWAGRINKEKGLEDTITAIKKTTFRLLICGYIEDKDYFEKIIPIGDQQIRYLGFLNTARLQHKLGSAEALIVTATCKKALNRIVLESLACGTPVIGYETGSLKEILSSEDYGLITPKNTPEGIVTTLNQLSKCKRKNARKYIEATYALPVYEKALWTWLGVDYEENKSSVHFNHITGTHVSQLSSHGHA